MQSGSQAGTSSSGGTAVGGGPRQRVLGPSAELEQLLAQAWGVRRTWGAMTRQDRGAVLVAVADALDAATGELVRLAQQETKLTEARLRGELTRTTFQLRLFAEVLDEGGYLDARVDHADADWGMGPRPDLRRHGVPVGPVLVFGASNFPFAFGALGGDTASALAAGCPVLVKAHPGHPALARRTVEIAAKAAGSAGAPLGVLGLFEGLEDGQAAVVDRRVKACGFTGSQSAGRALFDLAVSRPDPIPFYGELSSVNPAFVTPAAAAQRPEEIATGFVGSFTLGAGQFCTKPGLLVVPADSSIPERLEALDYPGAAPLLNENIYKRYVADRQELVDKEGVATAVSTSGATSDPPTPSLVRTTAEEVVRDPAGLIKECFGPLSVVVTYRDADEALTVARALEGELTATIQGVDQEDTLAGTLVTELSEVAGRVLWNGWPTGVTVSYAQQHGGPYPATTAPGTTSVGTAAITRFLRPVAYQNLPAGLLPADLRDTATDLPRRVDGQLVAATSASSNLDRTNPSGASPC